MLTFAQKTSDATHRLIERLHHEVHDTQPRSVLFIAARSGEGTSTIVQEYAWGLMQETSQNVLVIHTTAGALEKTIPTLCEVAAQPALLEKAIITSPQGISTCVLGNGEGASAQAAAFDAVQETLLKHADVLVIDAPSLEKSGLGIVLATKVQASVMVVATETTPQPVVRNLRDRLSGAGAKLVGVVLGKRRYYIPQKIYARL